VALYQGPFLANFSLLDWSAELEEWVYSTREFIASRVRGALLQLAEQDAAAQRFEQAASRAERAYLLPGAPEPEVAELARICALLTAGGSLLATQALRQARELGVELPTPQEARARYPHEARHLHNLPVAKTSFVGRDPELLELAQALAGERLVTLLGPGGVGKTRLALQLAHEDKRQLGDAYFVALGALRSPREIPEAIAAALRLSLQGRDEPLQEVIRAVGDRRLLVILDNFEHLSEGAGMVSELLAGCPELKLLVTSRERLGLEEEFALPLQGLPVPEGRPPSTEAEGYDAVRLFVQRAKRARLDYALSEADVPYVLDICRLTEGSPLGLELAAAWVKMMRPADIAKEMRRSFDLLETPSRNIESRHRSLRAVFDSSWTRLAPKEQIALSKLTVFSGGFSREAVGAVADITIPVLASLVDKSLLRVSEGRYGLHSLLYQYAREKLAARPEVHARAQRKHAVYFLALAEEAALELSGAEQKLWLERLEEEHNNLRAALGWAEAHDLELGLRLAGALWRFWRMRGHLSEGRRWLAALLEASPATPTGARAEALRGAGVLAFHQGDVTPAAALCEESLLLFTQLGDAAGRAGALSSLGNARREQGEYARATALYEESLALYRKLEDALGVAVVLNNLGYTAKWQGELEHAGALYRESLELRRRQGDIGGVAYTLDKLAEVARDRGEFARARALAEESLTLRRDLGDKLGIAGALDTLGTVIAAQGEPYQAAALLQESLMLYQEVGERWGVATVLSHLADSACLSGGANALELYHKSLTLYREIGDVHGIASVQARLGARAEKPVA
jgi:predicted ATPase